MNVICVHKYALPQQLRVCHDKHNICIGCRCLCHHISLSFPYFSAQKRAMYFVQWPMSKIKTFLLDRLYLLTYIICLITCSPQVLCALCAYINTLFLLRLRVNKGTNIQWICTARVITSIFGSLFFSHIKEHYIFRAMGKSKNCAILTCMYVIYLSNKVPCMK